MFERRAREGRMSAEVDLFGMTPKFAGAGVSAAGRPRLSVRLMVGLLYLKHAYNESDESVYERWAESVYFQYFCGEDYFQPRLPCDPTNLVRFRQPLEPTARRCASESCRSGICVATPPSACVPRR
jgi:IS5 family transposase